MRQARFPQLFVLSVVVFFSAASVLRAEEPAKPHKTDWLHNAKWGVMYHLRWDKDTAKFHEWIDGFDVKGLAKQLHEVGAGYFLVTAKHATDPFSPNAAYEAKFPGKAPKRDLIMELADELAKYDIKLMLYFACGMKYPPQDENTKFSAAMIEEFSKRYGAKVKGWWFDNNDPGRRDLQKLIADAARSGNPDALVAFSPPKMQRRGSPFDDYTAGNTAGPNEARCTGRFVDGLQWHMLSPLGGTWTGGRNPVRWPPEQLAAVTKKFTDRGGVVTWDVAYNDKGLLADPVIPALKAIGEATGTAPKK